MTLLIVCFWVWFSWLYVCINPFTPSSYCLLSENKLYDVMLFLHHVSCVPFYAGFGVLIIIQYIFIPLSLILVSLQVNTNPVIETFCSAINKALVYIIIINCFSGILRTNFCIVINIKFVLYMRLLFLISISTLTHSCHILENWIWFKKTECRVDALK